MTFMGKPTEPPHVQPMRRFRVNFTNEFNMNGENHTFVEAHYTVTDDYLKFCTKSDGDRPDFVVNAFHNRLVTQFYEVEP